MRKLRHSARIIAVLCAIHGLWGLNAQEHQTVARISPFLVTAYAPSYALHYLDPSTLNQVDRIIYFGVGISSSGAIQPLPAHDLRRLKAWREQYDLEIYLGVIDHGGMRTHALRGFDLVLRNNQARQAFVSSVRSSLSLGLFQGIDIDWEWPSRGWESEEYATLLSDLTDVAAAYDAGVSAAMTAWQTIPRGVADKLSQINLMLYDNPDRHSTFEDMVRDVKSFIEINSLDPHSVSAGIPFYGRGLPQKGKAWGSAISYRSIVEKYRIRETTEEVDGYYFNSLSTILEKTRYSIRAGLGGIMIWHLGMDTGGNSSLTAGIRREVNSGLNALENALLAHLVISDPDGVEFERSSAFPEGAGPRERQSPSESPSDTRELVVLERGRFIAHRKRPLAHMLNEGPEEWEREFA